MTFYNTDYVRIQDVVIQGAGIQACSQHIQILNSQFSGDGLAIRNDGCTPNTNLDILIDGNTFYNLPGATWEGRVSIYSPNDPSGITLSNNIFGQGGCSDGLQIIGNTGGLHVGPGNIFRDLLQGSCGPHVDAIQEYGAGANNVIEGNYFINNTVNIGIYDGGSPNSVVRNNVFDVPNGSNQALQLGGINGMVMEHNTFKNTILGVGTKSSMSQNTNWVVQNNIFENSDFTASGDQPGCGSNCIVRYNLKSNGGTTNPTGTNNITGNAQYVGVGSVTNWAGWQLAAGSPGKNAGNDGLDMGTTYYGLEAEEAIRLLPPPPQASPPPQSHQAKLISRGPQAPTTSASPATRSTAAARCSLRSQARATATPASLLRPHTATT